MCVKCWNGIEICSIRGITLSAYILHSVSANTAIYQCGAGLVFIISVPLLGERVTVLKVASVIFTIAGVCVISLFEGGSDHSPSSQNETVTTNMLTDDSGVRSTPMGYVVSSCNILLILLFSISPSRLIILHLTGLSILVYVWDGWNDNNY